jgi:hypothetical protein
VLLPGHLKGLKIIFVAVGYRELNFPGIGSLLNFTVVVPTDRKNYAAG